MNGDLISNTKSKLERYEETIEDLDKNFDKIKRLGRYPARAPLKYKHIIFFIIKYLEEVGADLSELKKEYERMNKKLMAFEEKKGEDYQNKLYEELKYFVDKYYSTICYFLLLDPVDMETENDLAGRDAIEILLTELEHDYDLHDMKIKVSALDEALKCKFKTEIDTILKECPDIEKPYFPESYWWRHPSKFLKKTT